MTKKRNRAIFGALGIVGLGVGAFWFWKYRKENPTLSISGGGNFQPDMANTGEAPGFTPIIGAPSGPLAPGFSYDATPHVGLNQAPRSRQEVQAQAHIARLTHALPGRLPTSATSAVPAGTLNLRGFGDGNYTRW